MWRLFRLIRPGDTVIAMTDPPLLGIGAWLITSLRGGRLFHWVQDIYPELAIELAGQWWLAALKPLRNLAWRRAAGCVTLGTDMAAVIAKAGVAREKLFTVPNWPPWGITTPQVGYVAALRAKWGLTGKFVVAYSGNLGRVHDLEPVLELAGILRDERHIAFIFIGAGAQQAALETKAAELRLAACRALFRPNPIGRLRNSDGLEERIEFALLRPEIDAALRNPAELHPGRFADWDRQPGGVPADGDGVGLRANAQFLDSHDAVQCPDPFELGGIERVRQLVGTFTFGHLSLG